MFYAMGLTHIYYFKSVLERDDWVFEDENRNCIVATPKQKELAEPHSYEDLLALRVQEQKLSNLS